VLTGANLANRDLLYLGISGDGDSASIGLGQFAHAIRRGVRMVYIVENNGVYGLTKGQFSATADRGSKSKKGVVNRDAPVDLIGMALQLGATYVARGFSGSTRSYDHVRDHNEAVSRIDFIDLAPEITAQPSPGDVLELPQPDGGVMRLRKLHEGYDATDRRAAMNLVHGMAADGEIATGLLYVDPAAEDLHAALNTVSRPLNALDESSLCPGAEALHVLNAGLR
jgi:2-oxoglutarate/2-oxoacid ferredoxin oxidoreductase subunit beta